MSAPTASCGNTVVACSVPEATPAAIRPAELYVPLLGFAPLHLPAMRSGFEDVARRAQQESQSYERYLLELTERECQARRGNRIERSLRDSRLPLEKTLGSLDLKRLPVKVVQQVRALLDGTFSDRRENVLAFGNPGSGKTHVLSAISHELIRSGRRVYFRNCGLMVQDLL